MYTSCISRKLHDILNSAMKADTVREIWSRAMRWTIIKQVICNPSFGIHQAYAVYKFKQKNIPLIDYISTTTGVSIKKIQTIIQELEESHIIKKTYSKLHVIENDTDTKGFIGNILKEDFILLYVLVRLFRPKAMIETGVASGMSTTAILAAMKKNKQGKLYSIDLPLERILKRTFPDGMRYEKAFPKNKQIGWLVPNDLKQYWDLLLGDVRDTLPPLLKRLGKIDIFFHDDLHTPEHMYWEFNLIWPYLKNKGILLSDDVNSGWAAYMQKKRADPYSNHDFFGIIIKKN